MSISILKQFKPLFEYPYTYYIYYGGRGGGKSEGIAQSLVLLATQKRLNILCIREFQSSIKDSSKAMLEKWIDRLGLWDVFNVTQQEILCKNGSTFIFKGLQSSNAANIKSITGINITWVEEGETISQRSWELLVPSVTREPEPKIIVSFNPRYEDDVVYKRFILGTPPPNSFVCKINHGDNPFFESTNLETQRAYDQETLPPSEYRHKWEGELMSLDESALWDMRTIEKLRLDEPFIRENYVRLVVAVDPATTSHETSNEYGIIVAGMRANGQIDVIDDQGGIYTPFDFGNKVAQVYDDYNADVMVVEGNQGGEHIRQVVLSVAPHVNYTDVWSSHDKVTRAMPVATLGGTGRVRHLVGKLDVLERQMQLMTIQGYRGPKGASPDRVDAYVWAISHLAELRQSGTQDSFFRPEMFVRDMSYEFREAANRAFVSIKGLEATILAYDVYSRSSGETCLVVSDCIITTPAEALKELSKGGYDGSVIPEIVATSSWDVENAYYYEVDTQDLPEKALGALSILKGNKIQLVDKMPHRSFNNEAGELLRLRIMKFMLNDTSRKHEDSAIHALLDLAIYYFA